MWIMLSRNRPHKVAQMFQYAAPTTRGIVAIDDDQVELYKDVKLPEGWKLDVSKRDFFIPKNNKIFDRYRNCDWYGSICDDQVPMTQNWDKRLVEAAGRKNIAWCEDGMLHLPTCVVLGGDLVRACGFLFVPYMKHFFGDNAHQLMAEELNIKKFLPDVLVEHRHFWNGKADKDRTYRERPLVEPDRRSYKVWQQKEWPWLKRRLQRELQ